MRSGGGAARGTAVPNLELALPAHPKAAERLDSAAFARPVLDCPDQFHTLALSKPVQRSSLFTFLLAALASRALPAPTPGRAHSLLVAAERCPAVA